MIIAVIVTAASVTDTVIGVRLLDKVVEHTPTVVRASVDAGFKHDLGMHDRPARLRRRGGQAQ